MKFYKEFIRLCAPSPLCLWTVRDTVWLYDGEKKTSVPLVSGIGSTLPEPEYASIGG
jgi:hypothetical protein